MSSTPLSRRLTSAALFASAICCVAFASKFLGVEVFVARHLFPLVGLGPTQASPDSFRFFALWSSDATRFTLTPQCGALMLCAPLMLVASFAVLSQRASVYRVVIAAVIGALGLALMNQFRLMVIGWSVRGIGFKGGFPLGHLLLGGIVSVFAVILAIVLFLRSSTTKAPKLAFAA